MINMRTQADRVQVALWDAVINSLSGLRSLRTYCQEANAPTLNLRKTHPIRITVPIRKFQVPVTARFLILHLGTGSLLGFLLGFLFGLLR